MPQHLTMIFWLLARSLRRRPTQKTPIFFRARFIFVHRT
jgi:hypothetical protein